MDKLVKSIAEILRDDGFDLAAVPQATHPQVTPTSGGRGPIHSTLPTDDIEFCEIIAEFETRLREKLADMRTAFEEEDFETLAQLAHWLKGSGGTAGFHDFTDLAKELQRLARAEGPRATIESVLREIEEVADCLVVPEIAADTPQC